MTERLKQLLDGEAHDLSVPPPPTDAVLRQGRTIRRRNRTTVAGAGLAAAVVIGGSVAALSGGGPDRAAPDPATPAGGGNAVFSYGNEVFYDGASHRAAVDDTAVKSLFYTSAGVLVRHGDDSGSDGGGPQRFSVITADGTVQRLSLETEETVHAADPAQPYVVYGEAVSGELQVVVHDVASDSEAARVTVGPTTETWFPVSLDGDTVYVQDGYDGKTLAVDWATGEVTESDIPSVWEVHGGHVVSEDGRESVVIDIATGDVVASSSSGTFDLSPDGRYALLLPEETELEPGSDTPAQVLGLDSDSSATLIGNPYDWGWTADGDLFRVEKQQVTTCSAETGECASEPYAQPDIPDPGPLTQTMSDPVCPDGGLSDCYNDEDFLENCYENRDECEWQESKYIEERSPELKLGGRTYES